MKPIIKEGFEPNYKRLGLDSKEEACLHILKCLKANEKRIMSKAIEKKMEVKLGEYKIVLKKRGEKK